jgi:hypothetical protein
MRFSKPVLPLLLPCITLALLFSGPVWSTEDDLQLWVPVTLEAPIPKLKAMRVSLELQPRLGDHITTLSLVRVRPSVTWDINPHVSVTAGYLWSPVFPKNAATTFENRLWQQLQLHHPFKQTTITHQLRLDERLLRDGNSVRGRYMLRAVLPLGKSPWRCVASNELLVNLNHTPSLPSGLNQNRTFTGLRRTIGKDRFIEGGYLLQYIQAPTSAINHVLVLRLQWALTQPDHDLIEDSPY